MLNKVILIGKVQEVQVTFTDEGLARLVLTVRTWQGKNTEFHRVVLFDPTVERAYKYYEILKDKNYNGYVYVEGRLNYRTFQGQDGIKRKSISIIARQIRLISPPSNGQAEEAENTHDTKVTEEIKAGSIPGSEHEPQAVTQNQVQKTDTAGEIIPPEVEEFEEFNEDDVPF